jgi:hypothetical protein
LHLAQESLHEQVGQVKQWNQLQLLQLKLEQQSHACLDWKQCQQLEDELLLVVSDSSLYDSCLGVSSLFTKLFPSVSVKLQQFQTN